MQAQLHIRNYAASDAPRLGEIFQSAILQSRKHYNAEQRHAWACDRSWNPPKWQVRMDGIAPFLAVLGDKVVGYADVQADGLIDHFFVDGNTHGQGVGKLLMLRILHRASELGLQQLHSDVSQNAQGFYAQFGFMPKRIIHVDMDGVKATTCHLTRNMALPPRKPRPNVPNFKLVPCVQADFEAVLQLRIAAMRPSLERLDRFDPERARQRLADSFEPQHGQHIVVNGQRVGFVTVKPRTAELRLEHLYLQPQQQAGGLGGAVLGAVIARADAANLPLTVGVLDQSPALRFYLRHGFVVTAQSEFDWELARPVTLETAVDRLHPSISI